MKFVYDGYKLVEELDGLNSDALSHRYVWQTDAVGLDVPVSVYDAATDKTYFYHTDANKNITELTNNTGAVVARYEYSPFGMQTVASGAFASDNPFRFSSEYFDSETGLVYYNYRYYNPQLGRWLSRDSIEEKGGMNLYAFVYNSPLSFYDMFGLANTSDMYNKYGNPTTAARNRGKYINPRSKKKDIEYCGMVCKKCNPTTGKDEYFTTQTAGGENSCIPTSAPCPSDSISVAGWHTHGGNNPKYDNENYSPSDYDWANQRKQDLYLVTPQDQFKQYIPNKDNPTEINRGAL